MTNSERQRRIDDLKRLLKLNKVLYRILLILLVIQLTLLIFIV